MRPARSQGPVLLALVNGLAIAALALDDRRLVADPFVATMEARSLLRMRAAQLAGPAVAASCAGGCRGCGSPDARCPPRRAGPRMRPGLAPDENDVSGTGSGSGSDRG